LIFNANKEKEYPYAGGDGTNEMDGDLVRAGVYAA
jgi:hypothetical protein